MRNPRLGALAGVAAAALVLAACGGAGNNSGTGNQAAGDAAPGVTDTEVVIGTHQPLTGPAAPGYSKISVGAQAMFSYLNDNGGINGRKITYKVEDDAYNPTQTVEKVKQLVLQDKVFAVVGGLGTPTHSKVVDYLNQQSVPDLFVSSGALQWDNPAKAPWTFGFQTDYTREGKILGKYVKDNFAGKKIGLFYQNDDVGRDAQAGIDQFVKDAVVSRQGYDPTSTDLTPQMSALKAAGAEVVIAVDIPAFSALSMLTSAKIGYKPQFVVSSIGDDVQTLQGLLNQQSKGSVNANSLLTGMIGAGYLPDAHDATSPWTQLFQKVHDKYAAGDPFTNTMAFGMAQAYTFGQALKAAGRDLTRQKLVDAVMSGNLVGPGSTPFAFSKDSHSGYTGEYVFTVNPDGSTKVIENAVVTDRGTGAVTPYTGAATTPAQVNLVPGS
jgi:ABC-type branched-subunit amino acid transport system substrate-binding protein